MRDSKRDFLKEFFKVIKAEILKLEEIEENVYVGTVGWQGGEDTQDIKWVNSLDDKSLDAISKLCIFLVDNNLVYGIRIQPTKPKLIDLLIDNNWTKNEAIDTIDLLLNFTVDMLDDGIKSDYFELKINLSSSMTDLEIAAVQFFLFIFNSYIITLEAVETKVYMGSIGLIGEEKTQDIKWVNNLDDEGLKIIRNLSVVLENKTLVQGDKIVLNKPQLIDCLVKRGWDRQKAMKGIDLILEFGVDIYKDGVSVGRFFLQI